MNFRTALLVPLALVVPTVAVACTSSGDSATSDGASTTTTTTAPAEPAAVPPMGSPPAGDTAALNIAQIAAGTPATQTVTRLVIEAGLVPTLATGGPFTVFAPVDDAFSAIDAATLRGLSADTAALTKVLTLHVVPGTYTTEQLRSLSGTSLTTAQGGALLVEAKGEDVYVGGAKIAVPDIMASNGVVHAVDTVILQPNG
jgi:uncharacterized surface protein with fasciclin (FAS1) repeats